MGWVGWRRQGGVRGWGWTIRGWGWVGACMGRGCRSKGGTGGRHGLSWGPSKEPNELWGWRLFGRWSVLFSGGGAKDVETVAEPLKLCLSCSFTVRGTRVHFWKIWDSKLKFLGNLKTFAQKLHLAKLGLCDFSTRGPFSKHFQASSYRNSLSTAVASARGPSKSEINRLTHSARLFHTSASYLEERSRGWRTSDT